MKEPQSENISMIFFFQKHKTESQIIVELPLAVRPAGVAPILIKACPSFFMVMASGMARGRMWPRPYDVAQRAISQRYDSGKVIL